MEVIESISQLNQLFEDNKKEIAKSNAEFLPQVSLVGAFVTGIAFVGGFFYTILEEAQNQYALGFFMCLISYALSKVRRLDKYVVVGLYLQFFFLFLLVLYLSVIVGIDRPASPMLILLAVFPMLFIDKPRRLLTVDVILYVVHSYLSFLLKGPVLGKMDLVNGLIATVVGCFFGWFIIRNRIQALNFERLLIMEKETDELTGLHNRRRLFHMIGQIEIGKLERPSGVFMMDIDYFKQYNDTNGHMAGDYCLRSFGKLLKEYPWLAKAEFFRYGGEEFVAFVWGADEKRLQELAEQIRAEVVKLEIPYGKITTSIGYAYCMDEEIYNYEKWIDRADVAAYQAKACGRNCVAGYRTESVQEDVF